jgi:hypothetical protein
VPISQSLGDAERRGNPASETNLASVGGPTCAFCFQALAPRPLGGSRGRPRGSEGVLPYPAAEDTRKCFPSLRGARAS